MARALRYAILGLALLVLAACGSAPSARTPASSTPPASPAPTIGTTPAPTATPTPAAAAGDRCLVSQLSLSTGPRSAGAGTIQETFILTNTGSTTCQLVGYPGMQMLSGGQNIPTKVVRTPGPEPAVTLAPGATSSFLAQWHDQTGYTTPCASSQQVQVTPPNATEQLTLTASIQACPDGTINVTAVTAGSTGGQ